MNPGKIADVEIALKIMGQIVNDPIEVPAYSTDTEKAYLVLTQMQRLGWACAVSVKINDDGTAIYVAKYFQNGNKELIREEKTLAFAICNAALEVIKQNKTQVAGTQNNIVKLSDHKINVDESDLINFLYNVFTTSAANININEKNVHTLKNIFEKSRRFDGTTNEHIDQLLKNLSKLVVDELKKNKYNISK